MQVTSDFECGNGKNIGQLAPGHFRVDEEGEKAPYCKYFCVRIDGDDKPQEVRLDIYPDPNMGEEGRAGMIGHYPSPLWISEDGMSHWSHITGRWPGADEFSEEKISTRLVVPAKASVFVASNVAFPYSKLQQWAATLARGDAKADSLGKSFEGREIPRLHLPCRGLSRPKLRVFAYSGEHPSEHCGPLAVCGIADFLASKHPEAMCLRQFCNVWVVPMINVDGNVRGRNGWTMENVNPFSDYVGAAEGQMPKAVEDRLLWQRLSQELRPHLLFNFHGYMGTRRFADPPYDGCYALAKPNEVYADPSKVKLYEAVRDTLFWDTPGLTARATPGTLGPESLCYQLAKACGTLVPFYEINHSFPAIQGAKRRGADVFRAVMRTVERLS